MANKDNLIKLVAQKLGPDKLQQMVDQAAQALGNDPDVTPEVIDKIIQMFEYVAEHPEEYQSVIQQAIQTGALDEGDLPPTFDPTIIAVILLAFYGLRDKLGAQQPSTSQMAMPTQDAQMPQMAMGGLHQAGQRLQNAGRGGDTILAHITPQEANLLERRGGTGEINPATGLPEYGFFKKLKKIAKVVLPIAVSFIPGIGPVAAAALSGLGTAALGGSLKESLLAGAAGALGTAKGMQLAGNIGKSLNTAIPGLSTLGLSNQVLGAGVLGGATSGLMGKNIVKGALTAGLTSYAAPKVAEYLNTAVPGSEGVTANMIKGANLAAQTGGNPIVAGGTAGLMSIGGNLLSDGSMLGTPPSVAGQPSATVGDGTGVKLAPVSSDPFASADPYALPTSQYGGSQGVTLPTSVSVADGSYGYQLPTSTLGGSPEVQLPSSSTANIAPTTGALSQVAATGTPSTGFGMSDIAKLGIVGALLGGKTQAQATQAIQDSDLTAQQKEGMLRSLTNYKFDMGRTTFPSEGTPEWDKMMSDISQGKEQKFADPTLTEQPALARGGKAKRKPQGALSQVSRLSLGAGDGRSDSIDAKLSDGEYVIDAETVALLGNGSTKAGAAMLDQMRQGIRQQKGKALAKGNFSPNAKSPLAYMKGGLR